MSQPTNRRPTPVPDWLEWLLALLALAVVPALILEDHGTTPIIRAVAQAVNWFVWLAFAGEFAVRLYASRERRTTLRDSWFDITIIVLSPPFLVPDSWESLRALRALRLLRVLRAVAVAAIGIRTSRRVMARQRLVFIAFVAVLTVSVGAVAALLVERGENTSIQSLPDALWWAAVTATTVGYGDISPVTWEGRLIAVALMLVGIGVIGVFTATVASAFLAQDADADPPDPASLEVRLATIERKLDLLIDARGRAVEPETLPRTDDGRDS